MAQKSLLAGLLLSSTLLGCGLLPPPHSAGSSPAPLSSSPENDGSVTAGAAPVAPAVTDGQPSQVPPTAAPRGGESPSPENVGNVGKGDRPSNGSGRVAEPTPAPPPAPTAGPTGGPIPLGVRYVRGGCPAACRGRATRAMLENLQSRIPDTQHCFDEARARMRPAPTQAEVKLRLRVQQQGNICQSEASVTGMDAAFTKCIADTYRNTKTGLPVAGCTDVTLSLNFKQPAKASPPKRDPGDNSSP